MAAIITLVTFAAYFQPQYDLQKTRVLRFSAPSSLWRAVTKFAGQLYALAQ